MSPKQCPPFDDLSAWYDQEIRSAAIDDHVSECAACRRVIADFETIEDECATLPVIGDEARQRIQAAVVEICESTEAPPQVRVMPMPVRLAVAAGFVIALLAFALMRPEPTAVEPVVASVPEPPIPTMVVVPEEHVQATVSPADEVADVEPLTTRIPPDETTAGDVGERAAESTENAAPIRLVGTRFSSSIENRRPVREPVATPHAESVADVVRHVWIVSEAAQPLRALKGYMSQHAPFLDDLIDENRDRYQLRLSLSDRDLQSLVTQLHSLDFRLVSPSAPQPNRDPQLQLPGKRVFYEVDFVQR